ncbi:MAG TPA: DEAD/DEAH box helicase, partial [Isosphaeraceae bacterium]|nr:DEAD/DEAH box helicase [Isosphaeraceae bacterium]
MSTSVVESAIPVEESEAYRVLIGRTFKKTGKLPAEALVRHVLACVPAEEWPVRVEAMDALLRRVEAVHQDKLRIEARPADGRLLGLYATRRPGAGARPYRTLVQGVDPIRGRCDCPDYLRNSLGLCKHILTVLEHIHARPRVLRQAIKEQEWADDAVQDGLWWDPIRPLTGFGDWLERVVWRGDPDAAAARSARAAQLLRWFRPARNGTAVLKNSYRNSPATRLELVEDLLQAIPRGAAASRFDPALHGLLDRERHRLKLIVEQTPGPAEIRAGFRGLKRPLYPFQREGVRRFLAAGRLLLADDMGLGKTAQAIAACEILWRSGKVRRGLVIAPASLKPQWAREWAVFSHLPVEIVDGSPEIRKALYAARPEGFFIINYEQLLRDLELVRSWDPHLVVLDEAQRIKNWATKTALSVKGLKPPYRLVLTGTPMENRIDELASVVEWVDDLALEPKWRLGAFHAIRVDGRNELVGVRNLGTIRDRLRHCLVRRVRQEVLDQLPPRTDTRVPVAMTEAQQVEHDQLNQPILVLMQKAQLRPLTQAEFLRLMSLLTIQRIICNGLAQLRFLDVWPTIRERRPEESVLQGLAMPKLIELRQLVRQIILEQGRKAVIFSQWRRMLTLAHWATRDLLAEAGLRAGFFTGAEGRRRRTQNIVEFHDHPDFRILFSTDAGGVGLNLQRAANCVINLDLPWNPAVLEQRIGRIYRLGQKQPIDVYNVISEQGIESRIATLVESKHAFFKGLFDGDTDTIQFGEASGMLARLQKLIDPSAIAVVAERGEQAEAEPDPGDIDLDDEVADPLDELIESADEDVEAPAAATADDGRAAPSAAAAAAAPGPVSSPAAAAGPSGSVPQAESVANGAAPPAAGGDVRSLFAQLQVRREPSGKVVIEAPAEAA